jgi:hypothetical protein
MAFDDYLEMAAARTRPNMVLAAAFDLKVFFSVVGKPTEEVETADVLSFIAEQPKPRRGCWGGSDRGWRGGVVGAHDQAPTRSPAYSTT